MFFTDQRLHFFKPLTSKYRAQIAECLMLLHQRLYGASAEYGQALNREQLLDIFEEALALAPELEGEGEEGDIRFKHRRECATWVLKQLLDCGWLDKQVDPASLQASYPFTRSGRLFAQPLVEANRRQVRTRHRNTRNTLNALEAFSLRGEVHDLLDAYEFSERIIADFTDVISELEERKRELAREAETQLLIQQASEHFFAFMEQRFKPDLAVRLTADSVEKHRDRLTQLIGKIRRKDKTFKTEAEQKLRAMVPEWVNGKHSLLWHILDSIELRMQNAAEIMLPALRQALQSFTKRADIIIRQLGYLSSRNDDRWLKTCEVLAALPAGECEQRLQQAAACMSGVQLGLLDPAHIKLHQRQYQRPVNTFIDEPQPLDNSAQRELMVGALLDTAFLVNNKTLQQYVRTALSESNSISTRQLPINSAQDLLNLAYIIELGAVNNQSSNFRIRVDYNQDAYSNTYFQQADDFTLTLEPTHEP